MKMIRFSTSAASPRVILLFYSNHVAHYHLLPLVSIFGRLQQRSVCLPARAVDW